MSKLFTYSEAENSFDFALEEIIDEKKLNEKIKLSDILDSATLPSDEIKKLEEIGARIIDDKETIWLLYDSKTNKYYKWINKKIGDIKNDYCM